jgi:Arc/MetJ-type ribon-helix-helix transcriptional regulator
MEMDKKRPSVVAEIDGDLHHRIEEHRFRNRFSTQSAAVRDLLRRGLERDHKPADQAAKEDTGHE